MHNDSNTSSAEIPYGFCHCGCGQRTKINTRNDTAQGKVKGEPSKWRAGHHRRDNPIERFWSQVDRTASPTGCWLWIGLTRGNMGYGRISIAHKFHAVHRFSWELHNGKPVPEGVLVCHRCDVPACVNPDHLFLGTVNDNVADRVTKGRTNHGEEHPNARLTDSDIVEIRQLYSSRALTQVELAARFHVSSVAISCIVRRKTWKHVP